MNDLLKIYKALSIQERTELALSINPPQAYRQFLATDQWNVIRCYFARRADLTPSEIAILIRDDDHVIRLCVAKRDDLTAEMIEQCVVDRDPNVRHAVSRNPLLTPIQRDSLIRDEDELVKIAAKKGPRAMRYRQREGQAKLIK